MNVQLEFEHPTHSIHDAIWVFSRIEENYHYCIACAVELCFDSQTTSVKKHFIISEMLTIFEKHKQASKILLENNLAAAFQIISVLFDLISENKKQLSEVGSHGISIVLTIADVPQLKESVFFKILEWFEKPSCDQELQPILVQLLSNILHLVPSLNQLVNQHCSILIEYICKGLNFLDINMKKVSLNLILQILKQNSLQCCPVNTIITIAKHTVKILETHDDKHLNHSALAVLRRMIHERFSNQILFCYGADEASLPMMFKKKLLLKDCILQLSCIQCMTVLIQQKVSEEFAQKLLEYDVVEILFELLDSEDDNLVASILCCLLSLTDEPLFFEKHHSLFGFDSILRTTERLLKIKANPSLGCSFSLMNQIFLKHSSSICLFPSIQISQRTMIVLMKGVENIHRKISNEAIIAATHLFEKNHIQLLHVISDIARLVKSSFVDLDKLVCTNRKSSNSQHLATSFDSNFVKRSAAQVDIGLEARLSLLLSICQILSNHCMASSVTSQFQNEQTDFENIFNLINQIINEVEEKLLPFILKHRNIIHDDNVFVLILSSLCCLMNLSPEFRIRFSFFAVQIGILQFTWELKIKNGAEVALTEISNEFLSVVLYTLIVESNLIQDNKDVLSFIKAGLKYFHGSIEESCIIFNDLYADNEAVLPSQETLLSVLYFLYLYCEWQVTQEFIHNIMMFVLSETDRNNIIHRLHPFSQKHLLFLFAICDLELHDNDHFSSPNSQKPDLIHCRKMLVSCMQRNCNLDNLYTHHINLLRWTFLAQEISDVFSASVIKGWIHFSVLKKDESFDVNNNEMQIFLMMCNKNIFCFMALLNMLPSQSEEFQSKALFFLSCLIQDETVNGMNESCTHITSETRKLFPNLLKEFKKNRGLILILLKLLCHFCTVSTVTSYENTDLKFFAIMCTALNTIDDDVCLVWGFQYLINILHKALEINEIKFYGLLLTDKSTLPKIVEALCSSNSDLQINCLNLLSLLIHYQATFNIQPCKFIQLNFQDLYRLLFSPCQDVILAAVHLFSLLFKVSFNCIIRIIFNHEANNRGQDCYVVNATSLRSLYITLQNISVKNNYLQEATIRCLYKLLKFIQSSDILDTQSYFTQPWIAIVFYANKVKMLDDVNCEEVKLLLLFITSSFINVGIGSFLVEFISVILNEKCTSNDQDDSKLYLPLLKKVSHSIYLKSFPKILQNQLKHNISNTDVTTLSKENKNIKDS